MKDFNIRQSVHSTLLFLRQQREVRDVMNTINIAMAIQVAKEFLQRATDLKDRLAHDKQDFIEGCKESAALRRTSMNLTRALAEMRRP